MPAIAPVRFGGRFVRLSKISLSFLVPRYVVQAAGTFFSHCLYSSHSSLPLSLSSPFSLFQSFPFSIVNSRSSVIASLHDIFSSRRRTPFRKWVFKGFNTSSERVEPRFIREG
ncbi:hypothetical protein LY78DRAFT_92681 [Colletotrichum sublineola]|nr:hypothetical protein LY78DRAFT_92681 [Colletotrichum sublineola]